MLVGGSVVDEVVDDVLDGGCVVDEVVGEVVLVTGAVDVLEEVVGCVVGDPDSQVTEIAVGLTLV